ncbi:1-deoxy-D-xylulose 5-phosphate synthase [Fusobacterium vincentii ATCC 49256]|nr:1-deoxy-D-xylulose 5-phosphate synthase [Fusobacterium vincentii ATCC 49256]
MYLEKINSPEDVKKLNIEEMKVLAQEIREAIITRDAKHGGHFGPNLGIIEATISFTLCF